MGVMRRAIIALCALLGAVLLGAQSPSIGAALVDEPDPWPTPSGDPRGPDGVYGPKLPALEDRLRPGDASAGLLSRVVPQSGSGEFDAAQIAEEGPGEAIEEPGDVLTVDIEVERDLAIDLERFADFVVTTLNDERGWSAQMDVAFAHAGAGTEADLLVRLATPDTVDDLCDPLPTGGEYSCATPDGAVLNALRWAEGAETFSEAGGNRTEYRHYLVNHEVGHLLGHGHAQCPAPGEPAPVMVQQSITLDGCEPNGWIVPD